MKAALLFLGSFMVMHVNALDSADCVRTLGCIRKPDNCQDAKSCDFIVMFKPTGNNVIVDFAYKGDDVKWIALGMNPTSKSMENTRAFVCSRSSALSTTHYVVKAPKHTSPNWSQYNKNLVSNVAVQYTDGVLMCSFTRPLAATGPLPEWNNKYYIILAQGKTLKGDGTPSIHSNFKQSETKLNLTGTMELKFSGGKVVQGSILVVTLAAILIRMIME